MKCLKTNPERLKNRRFAPNDINLCNWEELKPLLDDLLNRTIQSEKDLEILILDSDGLASALQEESARIQLATSRNTADEQAKALYKHFNTDIMSKTPGYMKRIEERILKSEYLPKLPQDRFGQYVRLVKNSDKLFRDDNVPLSIEDAQLGENYSALAGGLTVEFEGKTHNMTQMRRYLKETDRDLRERAWRAMAETKTKAAGKIDEIYSRMIQIREKIAHNADFENYRDFRHMQLNRFDYTPDDCRRFHESIEKYAVPIMKRRREKRRKAMGLKTVRPWDVSVDVQGRPPLKPFKTEDELVDIVAGIMDKVYPDLGDNLRLLHQHDNLDLLTRNNKAPVGFNMPLDETRVSFIFMNAQGIHHDIMVLLHEAGHAVETRACSHENILSYRHTPQEWGECASQSMELLGLSHLDVVYDDREDRKRCILEKLDEVLLTMISSAKIDAFQQWIYTHADASPADRDKKWLELSERFADGVDDSGLEEELKDSWKMIPHLFIVPFYYIEYGIAELASLQVWRNVRKDGHKALERWFNTMTYGYGKPIPELYELAGLKFQFHGKFAEDLFAFVESELDRIEKL